MNRIAFIVLFLLIAQLSKAQSQPDTTLRGIDPVRAEQAKSLALNYIHLLAKGDNIDSLLSLCDVPFSWDRKKIISDWATFKKEQQGIIDEKGKNRQFDIDTIYVRAIRKEMLDAVVPVHIYYVIVRIKHVSKEKQRTSSVLFAVQISDNPKIVGISD